MQSKYFASMRRAALALLVVLASSLLVASPSRAQQTLFQDDFNAIDTNIWDVHDNSWNIHRTRFGKAPAVRTENGVTFARFSIDSYHPDPRYSGSQFLGTEMWSRQQFAMGSGVEFEVRTRGINIPRGIVYAFFTYKQRDFNNDTDQEEIDFEHLGNFINSSQSNKLWLNVWNGTQANRETQPLVPNLNQRDWNTYTIRWTNTKVEWLVNGVIIRTETEVVPDDFMSLCFNIWAAEGWSDAEDTNLNATSNAANNQSFYFDVDYVRVRTIPPPAGSGFVGTGAGLTGTYYDNMDFTNERFSRIAPRINFNWNATAPAVTMGADQWSVRWTGQIQPQYTQRYTFYTNTDDGVRLRINNQVLIDRLVSQGPIENTASINLTAGQLYPIEIEYFDNTGGALAKLEWSSSSTPRQLVPTTQLYPVQVQTPVFSPGGGTYQSAQVVTITSATPGADIHYTLNGNEPVRTDPTIANGGTLTLNSNTTLKAKAWRDGYWASNTQTANYLINNDVTPPAVTVSAPVHTWSYTQLPIASGAASDSGGSGLQSVSARLGRFADGQFWTGNASTWSTAPTDIPVNGTANWTLNLPTLPEGHYFFRASARDNAGNVTNSDVAEFFIDTTAPIATIATPSANAVYRSLAQASGSAQDTGPGVAEVRVSLFRYTDNTYWNGNAWTGATADVAANGTANWTWDVPALSTGRYALRAIARDYGGNARISEPVDFTIDNTQPILTITQPLPNAVLTSVPAAIGTANDADSGVREIVCLLQRADGLYWNNNNWTNVPANLTVSGLQNWSAVLPDLADGTYLIHALARDGASNDSNVATTVFTLDRTAPAVTISQPTNNSTITAWNTISGTIGDNLVGVARVDLFIRRADGQYWSGSGWNGTSTALSTTISGATWSSNTSLPPAVNGVYQLSATAYDNAGNSSTSALTSVTVNIPIPVDRVAPQIAITSPLHLANLTSLPLIAGTASDSGGSGLFRVEVVIQRYADNRYWSGRNWSVNSVRLPATISGNTWRCTGPLPSGANLKDDTYTIAAVAYDGQFNRSTAIIGVRLDSNAPQLTWTSPLKGARLSALPTLSGRAVDAYSGTSAVEVLIQRRSDKFFWNGRSWQAASVRLPATRSGSLLNLTWSRSTNLPNGANLLPGAYDLVAVAYDAFGNRSTSIIPITIVSGGLAADNEEEPVPSSVTVSSFNARAGASSVVLQFTGALNVSIASNAARYEVRINGVVVAIETASYQAGTNSVILDLEDDDLLADEVVSVKWNNLLDSGGRSLKNGVVAATAR